MPIPEGYPEGYRLGFEMYLWHVVCTLGLIFGIFLLIKAYKSSLINRKQLYLGNGLFYIAVGLGLFFDTLGFIFPDHYNLFHLLNTSLINGTLIIFLYYWERNLRKIKFKPVIWAVILYIVSEGFYLYFFLVNINNPYFGFILLTVILYIMFFLYYLFIKFTIAVSGKLHKLGIILTLGMAFYHISVFLNTPPIYLIIPTFPPIISPLFLSGSGLLFGYALLGIIDGITAYYNQTHICTIHRGVVEKNQSIYYCPSCSTPYCNQCYEQVVNREGCWNCGHGISDKADKEFKNEEEKEDFEIIHKK